jgi:hypothetical protein
LKSTKSCFFDLTINTIKTANELAVITSISIGTSSFSLKAGDQSIINSSNAVTTCKEGFSVVNNSCVIANITQSCSANGGTGTQTSSDGGVTFGACQLASCTDSKYEVSTDKLACQAISCTTSNANITQAATVAGTLVSGCTVATCNSGYSVVGNSCVTSNLSKACSANGGTGTQTSSDGGVTFGSCQLASCSDSKYAVSTDKLSCQAISCTTSNANIANASSVSGTLVSGCTVSACTSGYSVVGNSCTTSAVSKSCSANGGTGNQTSNDGGVTFGSCQLTSCTDSKYSVSTDKLSCEAISCTTSNANISQAATVSGTLVSGCTVSTCNSGYRKNGNICELNQDPCSLADAIANGVNVSRSNSTVQGTNINGDISSCLLADNACDITSTLNSNKKSCDIKAVTITVNKLLNQASVVDTTLGKINCDSNCTTDSKSYDYGSMVVLSATAQSGYIVSNWAGCDTVSGNNCIISSLTENRTVTPVMTLKQLTLATTYSNSSLASDVTSLSVYKNGVLCSGSCLSSFSINDIARIVAQPNQYINIDSITPTGSISNSNSSVPNELSFTFNDRDVSLLIGLSYKSFATQPTITYTGGTLKDGVLLTKESSIQIITSNESIAREMLVSTSADCSTGSFVSLNKNKTFNPALNQTSNVSIEYKNGDKYSNCYSIKVTQDNTLPTISLNDLADINIANKNAYTISGVCSELNQNVTINVGSMGTNISCVFGSFSKTIDVSSVGDSLSLIISATITDSAGNTATANKIVAKDTVAPILTNSQSNLTSAGEAITISGSCESNLLISFAESSNTSNSPVACSSGSYQYNYTVNSGANGVYTITITESDLLGNQSSINVSYTLARVAQTFTTLATIPAQGLSLSYSLLNPYYPNQKNIVKAGTDYYFVGDFANRSKTLLKYSSTTNTVSLVLGSYGSRNKLNDEDFVSDVMVSPNSNLIYFTGYNKNGYYKLWVYDISNNKFRVLPSGTWITPGTAATTQNESGWTADISIADNLSKMTIFNGKVVLMNSYGSNGTRLMTFDANSSGYPAVSTSYACLNPSYINGCGSRFFYSDGIGTVVPTFEVVNNILFVNYYDSQLDLIDLYKTSDAITLDRATNANHVDYDGTGFVGFRDIHYYNGFYYALANNQADSSLGLLKFDLDGNLTNLSEQINANSTFESRVNIFYDHYLGTNYWNVSPSRDTYKMVGINGELYVSTYNDYYTPNNTVPGAEWWQIYGQFSFINDGAVDTYMKIPLDLDQSPQYLFASSKQNALGSWNFPLVGTDESMWNYPFNQESSMMVSQNNKLFVMALDTDWSRKLYSYNPSSGGFPSVAYNGDQIISSFIKLNGKYVFLVKNAAATSYKLIQID